MSESHSKAHLKLRPTRPDEVPAAALAEAIFLALALRGAPGHLAQAPGRSLQASRA